MLLVHDAPGHDAPGPSLGALDNFSLVNHRARTHLRANRAEMVGALLSVDTSMSPSSLAAMIRQMTLQERATLVHLAQRWNEPHAIEDRSFEFCGALALPKLSSFVTSIGVGAFSVCKALRLVEWDAPLLTTVHGFAFAYCKSLTLTTWTTPSLEVVGYFAFKDNPSLVLSQWDSPVLTKIHMYAFKGCVSLTLKEWHAPLLTLIDYEAFEDCSALVWENGCPFPLNISIEYGAFRGCTNLSELARSQIMEINPNALDPV